jgi:hypothetical protein
LTYLDPDADEAALIARITELEHAKSAFAVTQARAAVQLDSTRRGAEAAAGGAARAPRARVGQ